MKDRSERVDAALVGHRDVEQDHVDAALAHDVQRIAAIGRLGDDLEVDLVGEELPQSGPDHGMVIDDGNSDHDAALLLAA